VTREENHIARADRDHTCRRITNGSSGCAVRHLVGISRRLAASRIGLERDPAAVSRRRRRGVSLPEGGAAARGSRPARHAAGSAAVGADCQPSSASSRRTMRSRRGRRVYAQCDAGSGRAAAIASACALRRPFRRGGAPGTGRWCARRWRRALEIPRGPRPLTHTPDWCTSIGFPGVRLGAGHRQKPGTAPGTFFRGADSGDNRSSRPCSEPQRSAPSILRCLVAAPLSAACSPTVAQSPLGSARRRRPPHRAHQRPHQRHRRRPNTFRFDTFGDEAFWAARCNFTRPSKARRSVAWGPGSVPGPRSRSGSRVDSDALPDSLIDGIRAGKVNLDDPATTVALLGPERGGRRARRRQWQGGLSSIGITCALCHSVVDDSVAPASASVATAGANRDLNVGAIVGLSPDLSSVAELLGVSESTVRAVLAGWGPNGIRCELFLDGKGFRPDGKTAAVLIPPAFGLAGVNLHTWTGWARSRSGTLSSRFWRCTARAPIWMRGWTTRRRSRSRRAQPVGAYPQRSRPGHVQAGRTSAVPARCWRRCRPRRLRRAGGGARPAPVRRRRELQQHCHVPPLFTEPGWNMHTGAEIGIDEFRPAARPTSATALARCAVSPATSAGLLPRRALPHLGCGGGPPRRHFSPGAEAGAAPRPGRYLKSRWRGSASTSDMLT
jgi:hypothetical protein